MNIPKAIASLGIFLFLSVSQLAHSEMANAQGFIYGKVGTERGNIIRDMPGSAPSYRFECGPKGCKKILAGYLIKSTLELNQDVEMYLSEFEYKSNSDINNTAKEASTAIAQDLASTSLALANGAAEMNPLLGSSPNLVTLLAVGLVRHMTVVNVAQNTRLSFEERAHNLCLNTSIAQGAAANNLAVLATGAGALPMLIGLIVGQARMSACMQAAYQAHELITHQENLALLAHARNLASTCKVTLSAKATPLTTVL